MTLFLRFMGWAAVGANVLLLVLHEFGLWPMHWPFTMLVIAVVVFASYYRGKTDEMIANSNRERVAFENEMRDRLTH